MARRWWVVGLCALVGVTGAAGQQFVETFDGASNVGGWTYGGPIESFPPSGGNPGAYLRSLDLDTFAPRPRTTGDSIFTGNLRELQTTSIGIDLLTMDVDFSAEDRPLSLVLISDNGTPADGSDDWGAFQIGPEDIPVPGEGWKSFDFEVPSQETSLPAGWGTIVFGPNSPTDPDWNDVITDVAQTQFFYGDPEGFFIFQMWDVGMDNPRISYIPEPAAGLLVLMGLWALRRR